MAFFSHLLLQTVSYSRPTSTIDANGDRTYGSIVTVPAKIVGKSMEILDDIGGQEKGNIKVSHHQILTEADIRLGDRIWVEFLGDTPGNLDQARYPMQVRASPGIRNTATLYTVFM